MLCAFLFRLVFSQNKSAKTVADIWTNGTKLHIRYSDGSSKDMDIPSNGIQFSRIQYDSGYNRGQRYHQDVGSGEYFTIPAHNGSYTFYVK